MYRAAVILLLCAEAAHAHPNHAGGSSLGAGLLHLLAEPDHVAVMLAPLVAAVTIVALLRRRRLRRARRDEAAGARRPPRLG